MINKKAYVYVVDDDVSICKALSLLLRMHGFSVETFNSAEEFLNFKHPKVPSCLILDILLPNLNGFALQEAMAQQGILTPIIFITGQGDIAMSVKAMKAGAIDFLPKPFTEKEILSAVTAAISKSKIQNKKQIDIDLIKRRIKTLSVREMEVFRLVAQGMLNKQIALKHGTVLQTIKVHRSRMMQKMQAKTLTELIHFAQKAGVITSKS